MLRTLLSQEAAAIWPIISLVLFFAFFLSMLAYVYRRSKTEHFNRMSHVVFDDGGKEQVHE
jgi:cbb3-type cytochrome oxidase subunit 3